ncbi:MAG: dTMP kinase [Chloroflexota bacterium]
MSLFITFEGGEGSGKSTQAEVLYQRLLKLGIPAVLTHEPGGTPLGERVTDILKWAKDTQISALTELLLFNASRAELVAEVIRPSLEVGKVVISDRYTDSTLAYQGYGRGLPLDTIRQVNAVATGGLIPDLTIVLDVSVEAGFARKKRERSDRFQDEVTAFHERVRAGFLELAKSEPKRFLVVDATKSKSEIEKIIWQKVEPLLRNKGLLRS